MHCFKFWFLRWGSTAAKRGKNKLPLWFDIINESPEIPFRASYSLCTRSSLYKQFLEDRTEFDPAYWQKVWYSIRWTVPSICANGCGTVTYNSCINRRLIIHPCLSEKPSNLYLKNALIPGWTDLNGRQYSVHLQRTCCRGFRSWYSILKKSALLVMLICMFKKCSGFGFRNEYLRHNEAEGKPGRSEKPHAEKDYWLYHCSRLIFATLRWSCEVPDWFITDENYLTAWDRKNYGHLASKQTQKFVSFASEDKFFLQGRQLCKDVLVVNRWLRFQIGFT